MSSEAGEALDRFRAHLFEQTGFMLSGAGALERVLTSIGSALDLIESGKLGKLRAIHVALDLPEPRVRTGEKVA